MSNSKSNYNCEQSIGCDVSNCAFNANGTKCTAEHISVENKRATTQTETYCSTFRSKGNCTCD